MHPLIQGFPFAPGQARGVLRHGAAAADPATVCVLRQEEIQQLARDPAGIVLVEGAPLSHPALRLLSRAVPTVLLAAPQLAHLPEGSAVFLDGRSGVIARSTQAGGAAPPPAGEVSTRDGVRLTLRASVGSAAAAARARALGASGIGLVRSEYLLPADGSRPDAAFFAATLSELCGAAAPLPVTVRLVDIAGDKRPGWLPPLPGLAGALGLQGARLFDAEPVRSVYLAELEGLAHIAAHHALSVLIPYVVTPEELARRHDEIRTRLPEHIAVGAMVETPAAALAIEDWLALTDFVALGCNDLMQCLFAADRDLPVLRGLLDPCAPALWRLLAHIAARAGSALAGRVQVCGLLCQLPGVLPLMVGLGFRIFSVDPVMLPYLAAEAAGIHSRQAAEWAQRACRARFAREVRDLIRLPELP